MRKHLFFTGPIGCGKSTLLLHALGEKLWQAGGFLTLRRRHADGSAADFVLISPDGKEKEVFLDLTGAAPRLDMEVFARLGVRLLREEKPFLVLDEIGGVELLCPEFTRELYRVLERDIPIIGVVKGEGPAGALIQKLGLTEDYQQAASGLRKTMENHADTSLYTCSQFDKNALALAKRWVEEYVHE